MQLLLIVTIALHALAGVFWAGSTFVLARTQATLAAPLRRPQLGAATIAVLTGAALWHLAHAGGFGMAERVLALGSVLALLAALVQAVKGRSAAGQRAAAGLLMVTVLSMVVARYV
jgi:hypothetical protein